MKLDLLERIKKDKRRKEIKGRSEIKMKLMKLAALLLIIGLVTIGVRLFISSLYSWSYFNLTSMKIEGEFFDTDKERADYCNISLPVNILKINLKDTAYKIKELHPEIKEVVVKRQLPGTLLIILKRREPIAEIKVKGGFYGIDNEAFILPNYSKELDPRLPEILGIRESIVRRSSLKVCDSQRLQNALELIALLKESGFLKDYKINNIDVSNYRNITFYIDDSIEIKLGRDDFRKKIKSLKESLPSIKLDEVKYIDLRFEDVIIGTE